MLKNKNIKNSIAVAFIVTVILFLSVSCSSNEKDFLPNLKDRKLAAVLSTDSVTTLISDSGLVRYKIITAEWDVYDSTEVPYWFFPKKVYLERYNDSLEVESTISCDTARFYSKKELWELKKNVRIENSKGERFTTELMYWDQKKMKVYSDKYIKIVQKNIILSGYGFESNQSFTNYTIFDPNGPINIEESQTDSVSE